MLCVSTWNSFSYWSSPSPLLNSSLATSKFSTWFKKFCRIVFSGISSFSSFITFHEGSLAGAFLDFYFNKMLKTSISEKHQETMKINKTKTILQKFVTNSSVCSVSGTGLTDRRTCARSCIWLYRCAFQLAGRREEAGYSNGTVVFSGTLIYISCKNKEMIFCLRHQISLYQSLISASLCYLRSQNRNIVLFISQI